VCECRVVKTKGAQCHPKMSGLWGEMGATECSVVGYRRLLSEDRFGIRAAQRHVIRGNISQDTGEVTHLAQEISMQRLGWDGHPG
jgi:hypothetical protein